MTFATKSKADRALREIRTKDRKERSWFIQANVDPSNRSGHLNKHGRVEINEKKGGHFTLGLVQQKGVRG